MPDDRKSIADGLAHDRIVELSKREQALLTYAEKLTSFPQDVARADIDNLHAAGLNDREIHDAAHVIGYFTYVNRIVLGLGAELESPDTLGQAPE